MQGRFLDCARNDGMGEWVYFTHRTTDMFGKDYSRIVIPSEVEGSFWHTGIASYVRQRKRGNFCERSKKEQSARKISRYARNDGRGEWVYFT